MSPCYVNTACYVNLTIGGMQNGDNLGRQHALPSAKVLHAKPMQWLEQETLISWQCYQQSDYQMYNLNNNDE